MVDARSRERFDGRAPDPRPGVAPGHIPGSRNLPLAELYERVDFTAAVREADEEAEEWDLPR